MTFDAGQQGIGHAVGTKLRAARLARKYTQSQLAQPDFSVSYVSAIERGQIHPSLRALEIFAQRLGISSADLLSKQSKGSPGFSEKDATIEDKEIKELQLLEAQLLIHQSNERQAVKLLRKLAYDATKSEQVIQQRFLLGWAYYLCGYLQESESVLAETLRLVNNLDDFWAIHILNVLGLVHTSMHNHVQGFEYQLRILDQLEKEHQPHDAYLEAKVYNNIGLHYLDLGRTDDAIEMFQHTLSITKVFQSPDQLTSMYWEISRNLAETQHFLLAMHYSHKALQLLYREYSDSLRSEIYYYLGQAMLRQEQQNLVTNFEELLQNAELKKDTLALASVTASTAVALFQKGEFKKANEYAQSACKLAMPYGDSIVTATVLITLGRIAYALKDYQDGDTHFEEGLGILERLDTQEELSDQAANYAQLLEERKMPGEALRYYKKAYENSRKHE